MTAPRQKSAVKTELDEERMLRSVGMHSTRPARTCAFVGPPPVEASEGTEKMRCATSAEKGDGIAHAGRVAGG